MTAANGLTWGHDGAASLRHPCPSQRVPTQSGPEAPIWNLEILHSHFDELDTRPLVPVVFWVFRRGWPRVNRDSSLHQTKPANNPQGRGWSLRKGHQVAGSEETAENPERPPERRRWALGAGWRRGRGADGPTAAQVIRLWSCGRAGSSQSQGHSRVQFLARCGLARCRGALVLCQLASRLGELSAAMHARMQPDSSVVDVHLSSN